VDGAVEVLRNDHFTHVGQRAVDLEDDYMQPFFHRVAQTVRAVREDWLLFVEMNPYKAAAGRTFPAPAPERCVNSSHWYDITMLRTKEFPYPDAVDPGSGLPGPGAAAVRERYVNEMRTMAAAGRTLSDRGAPTLIGECGIPFDLENASAYRAWRCGDRSRAPWDTHVVALSLMYDALDRLLLSSTQWNYTASNRNLAVCGDGWNQEDLSIFSRDQQDRPADPDSGGRAVEGFSRPYARFIAGEPVSMTFDIASGDFTLEFDADPRADGPTEIFVPRLQYPNGYTVVAEGCDIGAASERTSARIFCREGGRRVVTISRRTKAGRNDT
jgi:hypothetical protein